MLSPGYYQDRDISGVLTLSAAESAAVHVALYSCGREELFSKPGPPDRNQEGETCSLQCCGYRTHQPCIWGDELDMAACVLGSHHIGDEQPLEGNWGSISPLPCPSPTHTGRVMSPNVHKHVLRKCSIEPASFRPWSTLTDSAI